MAKDPVTGLFEQQGPALEESFSQLGVIARDYRVELVWLGITGVAFLALYVGTHKNALAAGAIVYTVWMLLLALRPTRRLIRKSLTTSNLRRQWDKAVEHCGFPHAIPMSKVERVAVGHRARIRVGRGISFNDLEIKRPRLEASLAVRELRLQRDAHNAATGIVTLVRKDPLADVIGATGFDAATPPPRRSRDTFRRPDDMPPPRERFVKPNKPRPSGPSSNGGSTFWDPIPLGIGEHGESVSLTLPERSLLIGGMPNTGKSCTLHLVIARAALDPSVHLHLIDSKRVELSRWRNCADTFGCTIHEAINVLEVLNRIMDERYITMEEGEVTKVARGLSDFPLHLLAIDELMRFTDHDDPKLKRQFNSLLQDLAALGRAAGIIPVLATQKPLASVVPTQIRDLIAYRLAFNCATRQASDTILGSDYASSGFDASALGLGNPGLGWLLEEANVPVKLRVFHLDDEHTRALALRAEEGRQR